MNHVVHIFGPLADYTLHGHKLYLTTDILTALNTAPSELGMDMGHPDFWAAISLSEIHERGQVLFRWGHGDWLQVPGARVELAYEPFILAGDDHE